MRNFTLSIKIGESYIPLSSNRTDAHNDFFTTYDENLSTSENDQCQLTFSIVHTILSSTGAQVNPLIPYLQYGEELRLILDSYKTIDFIIVDVDPNYSSDNFTLSFTCQDLFSFRYAKQDIGFSYKSSYDGTTLAALPVQDIGQAILNQAFIEWTFIDQTKILLTNELRNRANIVTLEVEDSTPYGALIELANLVNGQYQLDYVKKTIVLAQKDAAEFSGYRYHPSTNLQSFDPSYSTNELATVLHVGGTTDANGIETTLIPPIPIAVRKFLELKSYPKYPTVDANQSSSITIDAGPHNTGTSSVIIDAGYHRGDEYINGWREYTTADDFGEHWFVGKVQEGIEADPLAFYGTDPEKYKGVLTTTITNQRYVFTTTYEGSMRHYVWSEENKIFYDQFITDWEQEQYDIAAFCHIADAVPNLSPALYDFSAFYNRFTERQKTNSHQLLNCLMRKNNLQLQLVVDQYYKTLIASTKVYNQMEIYAEMCGAQLAKIRSAVTNDERQPYEEEYDKNKRLLDNSAADAAYATTIAILYGSDAGNHRFGDLPTRCWTEYQKALNIYIKFQQLTEQLNNSPKSVVDIDRITLEADIELYRSQLKTYESLFYPILQCEYQDSKVYSCQFYTGHIEHRNGTQLKQGYFTNQTALWENISKYEWPESVEYYGTYVLFAHALNSVSLPEPALTICLYQEYHELAKVRNTYNLQLRRLLSPYFYEAQYTNDTETDAVSLYNQAIAHFNTIKHPQVDYSMTVLDIAQLEQIDIPRLAVGNKIKVFNKYKYHDSVLSTPTSTNWEDWYDDITITGISEKLRESMVISLTVEGSSRYKSILSKLIKLT